MTNVDTDDSEVETWVANNLKASNTHRLEPQLVKWESDTNTPSVPEIDELYDATADDEDEQWVNAHYEWRGSKNSKTITPYGRFFRSFTPNIGFLSVGGEERRAISDANLSCAGCFHSVSYNCKRGRYKTLQVYIAKEAVNCYCLPEKKNLSVETEKRHRILDSHTLNKYSASKRHKKDDTPAHVNVDTVNVDSAIDSSDTTPTQKSEESEEGKSNFDIGSSSDELVLHCSNCSSAIGYYDTLKKLYIFADVLPSTV